MTDYYVNDIAEETGELFGRWAEESLDMDAMVTRYLSSSFRENVDRRYAKFCTQTWDEMAEHFEDVPGDRAYDAVLCDWLGNFYTYLQERTQKSSRDLVAEYPFEAMYARSSVLHDLDMGLALSRVAG